MRIKKSEKFDALCPKVAVLREYLLEVEEQRIHALLWKDILEEKKGAWKLLPSSLECIEYIVCFTT